MSMRQSFHDVRGADNCCAGMDHGSSSSNITLVSYDSQFQTSLLTIDSIYVFMVYSVAFTPQSHSDTAVVVLDDYIKSTQKDTPLENLHKLCIDKSLNDQTMTFICPPSTPKQTHYLAIWGLKSLKKVSTCLYCICNFCHDIVFSCHVTGTCYNPGGVFLVASN